MIFLIACLVLGLFGALLGLIRGMKRSVCRIITIALSLVLAVILSGVAVVQLSGPDAMQELRDAGVFSDPETLDLLAASPSLVTFVFGMMRPFMFLVLFIGISIVLWVVYLLISIIFLRTKRDKNGKRHKRRGIGALVGLLQGILVGAFILTPILGYVSVAVGAMEELESSSGESITASIPEFNQYKEQYFDDAVTGAMMTVTSPLFDMTSSFRINGEKTNVRREIAGFLGIYSEANKLAGDSSGSGSGSALGDDQVKALRAITEKASESPVLCGILSDFLSNAAGKWVNGEAFAGQECPDFGEDIQPVMNALLEVFSTTNSTYIKEDMDKLVSLLELLSENGLLSGDGDVMQKINESDFLPQALAILDGRYAGVRREIVAIGHRALAESMGVTVDTTPEEVRTALEENCSEMVTGVTEVIKEKGIENAVGEVAEELKSQIAADGAPEGVSTEVVDKVAGYVQDKLNEKLEEDNRTAAELTEDDVYDVLSEFVTDPAILDELLMSLTAQ